MYRLKITTEAQKHEIESLIGEHGDALKAFGADCYVAGAHKTIFEVAIVSAMVYMIGIGAGLLVDKIKHKKITNKKKQGLS